MNECACGSIGPCQCPETEEVYGDSNSIEEKAIFLTLEWANRVKPEPTQEDFENQLNKFIKLLTNKQMNG